MATWKEIKGYEGLYLLSDEGVIVALPKIVKGKNKYGSLSIHRRAKLLKTCLRGNKGQEYEAVTLSKDGESKRYSMHRLVAETFLPNPCGLPEVNHIDENPLNNRVDNLEWCTHQYNIEYSKNKAVNQIKNGEVVGSYRSVKDASRLTGISRRNISNVLNGWSKTAGGYVWEYCI